MSNHINIRAFEYGLIQQKLVEVHNEQKTSIESALQRTRALLNHGFHADQTSQKVDSILAVIEQQLLPALTEKHRQTEENIEQLIQEIQLSDEVR